MTDKDTDSFFDLGVAPPYGDDQSSNHGNGGKKEELGFMKAILNSRSDSSMENNRKPRSRSSSKSRSRSNSSSSSTSSSSSSRSSRSSSKSSTSRSRSRSKSPVQNKKDSKTRSRSPTSGSDKDKKRGSDASNTSTGLDEARVLALYSQQLTTDSSEPRRPKSAKGRTRAASGGGKGSKDSSSRHRGDAVSIEDVHDNFRRRFEQQNGDGRRKKPASSSKRLTKRGTQRAENRLHTDTADDDFYERKLEQKYAELKALLRATGDKSPQRQREVDTELARETKAAMRRYKIIQDGHVGYYTAAPPRARRSTHSAVPSSARSESSTHSTQTDVSNRSEFTNVTSRSSKVDAAGSDLFPRLCLIKKWRRYHDNSYGFTMQTTLASSQGRHGHYLGQVAAGSPAALAGVRRSDRVVEVNGVNVEGAEHTEVVTLMRKYADKVTLLVVDVKTDMFYRQKGVVVTSKMADVVRIECPNKMPRDAEKLSVQITKDTYGQKHVTFNNKDQQDTSKDDKPQKNSPREHQKKSPKDNDNKFANSDGHNIQRENMDKNTHNKKSKKSEKSKSKPKHKDMYSSDSDSNSDRESRSRVKQKKNVENNKTVITMRLDTNAADDNSSVGKKEHSDDFYSSDTMTPSSSPTRSRSRSFSPTDHHLKNSKNPKLKRWLREKNKEWRRERRAERRKEKKEQQEKEKEEARRLEREEKSQKKVEQWMKGKRREARLLKKREREEKNVLKKQEKLAPVAESAEKGAETKPKPVDPCQLVAPPSGDEKHQVVPCTCGFVETQKLREEEAKQRARAEKVVAGVPAAASSKYGPDYTYRRPLSATKPARRPGSARRKDAADPPAAAAEENSHKEDLDKKRLSYDDWVKQKRDQSLERQRAEARRQQQETAQSNPEVKKVLSRQAENRISRIMEGKKRIDTGMPHIGTDDAEANKSVEERMSGPRYRLPSPGGATDAPKRPSSARPAPPATAQGRGSARRRPASAQPVFPSPGPPPRSAQSPAPGTMPEGAPPAAGNTQDRSPPAVPRPRVSSPAVDRVSYQKQSWDEFADNVWQQVNEAEDGDSAAAAPPRPEPQGSDRPDDDPVTVETPHVDADDAIVTAVAQDDAKTEERAEEPKEPEQEGASDAANGDGPEVEEAQDADGGATKDAHDTEQIEAGDAGSTSVFITSSVDIDDVDAKPTDPERVAKSNGETENDTGVAGETSSVSDDPGFTEFHEKRSDPVLENGHHSPEKQKSVFDEIGDLVEKEVKVREAALQNGGGDVVDKEEEVVDGEKLRKSNKHVTFKEEHQVLNGAEVPAEDGDDDF